MGYDGGGGATCVNNVSLESKQCMQKVSVSIWLMGVSCSDRDCVEFTFAYEETILCMGNFDCIRYLYRKYCILQ